MLTLSTYLCEDLYMPLKQPLVTVERQYHHGNLRASLIDDEGIIITTVPFHLAR